MSTEIHLSIFLAQDVKYFEEYDMIRYYVLLCRNVNLQDMCTLVQCLVAVVGASVCRYDSENRSQGGGARLSAATQCLGLANTTLLVSYRRLFETALITFTLLFFVCYFVIKKKTYNSYC